MAMNSFTGLLVCTILTLLYVGVLYIHPRTRPSATVSRNDDDVIKTRVIAILFSSVLSGVVTAWLLSKDGSRTQDALKLLGIWPIPPAMELFRSSLLITAILFIGPLADKIVFSKGWKYLRADIEVALTGWIGLRNYIIGPLTEEFVFRACIVSVELASGMSPSKAIFLSPLYFGLAHLHHAYEVYLVQPDALVLALLSSLFQFAFTTVFGWYATFLFLRTGSFWQPFIAHAFCNTMGVPKFGAKLDGPEWFTYAYNVLLVGGAAAFAAWLFPLTKTPNAII
ncbi:CAAX protease self-immunity-domain-containing protein [Lipomyces kononenkoae]|uniref:CAAX protease self-immunity-domain-containing protein n=1 Tax=Lipomyces kononenkoae TaxID=34357 RepID=A0ACC3T5D1_LIPKO